MTRGKYMRMKLRDGMCSSLLQCVVEIPRKVALGVGSHSSLVIGKGKSVGCS